MEFIQAFKRPFSDWKKLAIGIIVFSMLDFFGFIQKNLIIVGAAITLLGFGYVYQAAFFVIRKDMMLPEWKDWGDLFKKGLLLLAVIAGYGVPGGLVYWFSKNPIAGGIVLLIGMYLAPFALFNYMTKRNFDALTDFRTIGKRALAGVYFWSFILGAAYTAIVFGIVLQINMNVTFWVLKALVYGAGFYLIQITLGSLFALAWHKVKI